MKLSLSEKLGEISLEINRAKEPACVLILAHGAGAGMNHPFLEALATTLSSRGFHVVRFNFPYMEQGRKSPGSQTTNIATWSQVIDHVMEMFPEMPIFISGKSYGGRMASHLLTQRTPENIKGIIYFGFPLHAPGKETTERAVHLSTIKLPQLFIQGTRDKLANIHLIEEVISALPLAQLVTIKEGDHSFNVPKRTGITKEEVLNTIADESAEWMLRIFKL